MTPSHADKASTATPENSGAGHRDNGAGPMDQQTQADSAVLNAGDQAKVFHTLRAEFALKGFGLARTDARDGRQTYFITRWSLCKECSSLSHVAEFLTRIGGAA